ncbi:carbonic anhydrase 7-like [Daktulosphaira vitifoliae]|uniref:carbonic anhydrase 7-like n=1 Tax=Daktulosphaira vitifoliae TaxID=58002 RepID=UPI0021AA04A1|nr:carbonic anhydrase 7-like [Daktulosphaira vitifoliae]
MTVTQFVLILMYFSAVTFSWSPTNTNFVFDFQKKIDEIIDDGEFRSSGKNVHKHHQNSNDFENYANRNPQNHENTNDQFENYENQRPHHQNNNNQYEQFESIENQQYNYNNQNNNNNNRYENNGNEPSQSYLHNYNNNNNNNDQFVNFGNQRPYNNNSQHVNSENQAANSKWPFFKSRFPYPVQSPVNIVTRNAYNVSLPPLKHIGYWDDEEISVNITNDGHTVYVELADYEKGTPLAVTGGPLFNDHYILDQLHLHWGQGDAGSEHTFNGKSYAVELHIVHHNDKYRNSKEAQQYSDGMCVVSYFGEISDEDDEEIENFINDLKHITRPGSFIIRPVGVEFYWLRKTAHQRHYYTYPGSLTTEPFSECVTWITYRSPFKLSRRQLSAFRTLRSRNRGVLINRNDRDLQPFNNRPIIRV